MAGVFPAPTFTPDVALILDLCSETAIRQSVRVFAEAMKDTCSFPTEDGGDEVFPDGDFAAEVRCLENDIVHTIKEAARKATDNNAVQDGLESVVKDFYATRSNSTTKQRRAAGDLAAGPVVVPSKDDIHAAVQAAMQNMWLAPSALPDISASFLDDPQLADVAQLAAADLAQLTGQLHSADRRKRSTTDEYVTVADLRVAMGLVNVTSDALLDTLVDHSGSSCSSGLLDKRDATDTLLCVTSLASLAFDVVMLFVPFLWPSAVPVAIRKAAAIKNSILARLQRLAPRLIRRLSELGRQLADFGTHLAQGKLGQVFRLLFDFFKVLFDFGLVGLVVQVLCSGMGWKDAILFGVSTALALAAFFGSGGASLTLQAVAILAAFASVVMSAVSAVNNCYVRIGQDSTDSAPS